MPVFHLLYRSAASPRLQFSDLEDILVISRIRNAHDRITGLLVYRDHSFIQLIEGEEARVRALVERIRHDGRNVDLKVLAEVESEERLMPDWSMAWVDAGKVGISSQTLFELFDLANDEAVFRTRDSLMILLRQVSQDARKLISD